MKSKTYWKLDRGNLVEFHGRCAQATAKGFHNGPVRAIVEAAQAGKKLPGPKQISKIPGWIVEGAKQQGVEFPSNGNGNGEKSAG